MFKTELRYEKTDKRKHKLLEPLLYVTKFFPVHVKTGNDFLITIPRGFVTDGASIPRLVWTFVGGPFSGKYVKPAVAHDYLYAVHLYSRYKADLIFLEAMKSCGVSLIKRELMFLAVRVGGRKSYHIQDNDPENVGI